MKAVTRRKFLTTATTSIAAAGVSSLLPQSAWAQAKGANDAVRVGIVGIGWKGGDHVKEFMQIPGVRIVALCDADLDRTLESKALLKEAHQTVTIYQDYRKLLDDKNVDAVVIATPNHWHALMTIWACQAGKDVYVEKPVCHDVWEGQRMLEAEKKYGRIIQAGTQNRSNPEFDKGVAYLKEGHLGAIKGIHGIYYNFRESIGKVRGPQSIPASVDFNLYQGPAPMIGLLRKKLHYDWHWQWPTGNGDMGNIAAHTTDDVRRMMGDERQPSRVMSIGGRFLHNDDGQTPNQHLAILDYGDFPVFVEIRNLPHKTGLKQMDGIKNARQGNIVYCEKGYLTMGRGGVNVYSKDGDRITSWQSDAGKGHTANFIDAVRNKDRKKLNCPLEIGVKAGEIFHLANLSYRSGFPASPAEINKLFAGTEVGEAAWSTLQSNFQLNGIDLETEQLTMGSWLSLEKKGTQLKVHNPASELVAQALFQPRNYRSPFVVPEAV
jgi:predicted dehydrogenase